MGSPTLCLCSLLPIWISFVSFLGKNLQNFCSWDGRYHLSVMKFTQSACSDRNKVFVFGSTDKQILFSEPSNIYSKFSEEKWKVRNLVMILSVMHFAIGMVDKLLRFQKCLHFFVLFYEVENTELLSTSYFLPMAVKLFWNFEQWYL